MTVVRLRQIAITKSYEGGQGAYLEAGLDHAHLENKWLKGVKLGRHPVNRVFAKTQSVPRYGFNSTSDVAKLARQSELK